MYLYDLRETPHPRFDPDFFSGIVQGTTSGCFLSKSRYLHSDATVWNKQITKRDFVSKNVFMGN